jgi:Uma2 family endonuclease
MQLAQGQRLRLQEVDWHKYCRLLKKYEERPGIRLTYDRGSLEIMVVTFEHEGDAYLLGRFVDVLTEELELPVAPGRTTTLKLRKAMKGLEPDNCYWIRHESSVRPLKRIDLRRDPPPDLAIEVEVSRGALKRMTIYEALKVPEVWRSGRRKLSFTILDSKGRYRPSPESQIFPGLRPEDLMRFLALRGQFEHNQVIRRFREWVRQQIAAGVLTRPVF